jgi:hypothetical protein
MLYTEIIPLYAEKHSKHKNALCGQDVGFIFKPGSTYVK